MRPPFSGDAACAAGVAAGAAPSVGGASLLQAPTAQQATIGSHGRFIWLMDCPPLAPAPWYYRHQGLSRQAACQYKRAVALRLRS
jgi:hypothetical protein